MDIVFGLIIGIIIGTLLNALIIWIVGRLGLGMDVAGFGPAFIAALVIAVAAGLIGYLLGAVGITIGGGLLGAIIHLVIAALVLMIADKFVKGIKVHGFTGALVAAVAMALVAWLISWAVSLVF